MTSIPKPARQGDRPGNRTNDFKAVLSVLFCGVLATMLNSQRLVEVADRLEFGPERDRWLGAAQVIDQAASELYLDIPAEISDTLIDTDAPETAVVIGDLAAQSQTGKFEDEPQDDIEVLGTEDDGISGEPDPATQDPTSGEEPADTSDEDAQGPPAPPPLRTVSSERPLRLWVGGDSLGQFIGGDLKNSFADSQLSEVADDYNISTGLTRPDYFDWPARLTQEMSTAEGRPEALVLMLGGNDDQPMRRDNDSIVQPLTDAWADEYRSRVATVMDVSAYSDTRLFWINLPPMRDDVRNEITSVINEIVFDEAAVRSWVEVINIIPLFTSPEGTYTDQLLDPGGTLRKARAPDGVHLTATSSTWIAELVWESVSSTWEL
jgi:hypothetical protein